MKLIREDFEKDHNDLKHKIQEYKKQFFKKETSLTESLSDDRKAEVRSGVEYLVSLGAKYEDIKTLPGLTADVRSYIDELEVEAKTPVVQECKEEADQKEEIARLREELEALKQTVSTLSINRNLTEDVEDEHSAENVPEMPSTNCKMIIANLLNPLIKDELEAIDGYNSAVATIRSMLEDETTDKSIDYEGMIAVISEITNEENLHIGQLEKLLETVSPNAESIDAGKEEAAEQLEETAETSPEEVIEEE